MIVTNHDMLLMNYVIDIFPTSHVFLCRYHITNNVRGRINGNFGNKPIKGEDEKMVKPSQILIIDVWNVIINSFTYELYVECVIQLRNVCSKYSDFFEIY